jgi:hypothetical protein
VEGLHGCCALLAADAFMDAVSFTVLAALLSVVSSGVRYHHRLCVHAWL